MIGKHCQKRTVSKISGTLRKIRFWYWYYNISFKIIWMHIWTNQWDIFHGFAFQKVKYQCTRGNLVNWRSQWLKLTRRPWDSFTPLDGKQLILHCFCQINVCRRNYTAMAWNWQTLRAAQTTHYIFYLALIGCFCNILKPPLSYLPFLISKA